MNSAMDIGDQYAMMEILAVKRYEKPGDICAHLRRPLQLAHRPAFRERVSCMPGRVAFGFAFTAGFLVAANCVDL